MKKVQGPILNATAFGLIFVYWAVETVQRVFEMKHIFYTDWLIFFGLGAVFFYLCRKAGDASWAYDENGFELLKGPNKGKYTWSDVKKIGVETDQMNGGRFFVTKKGDVIHLSSQNTSDYLKVLHDVMNYVEKKSPTTLIEPDVLNPVTPTTKKAPKNAKSYFVIFVFTLVADVFEVYLKSLDQPGLVFNFFPIFFAPFPIGLFLYHLTYFVSNIPPRNSGQGKILLMSTICVFGPFVAFFIFIIVVSQR